MSDSVEIRLISATETRPLRSYVLRPGHPPAEAIFDGDDDPGTVHFGVFVDGHLKGVASLYHEAPPAVIVEAMEGLEKTETLLPSWRLRGMAVDPGSQRQGYGRKLLEACLNHVALQEGRLLWCNARTGALAFYQAAGFQTKGEEFTIPDIGPHFVMVRFLKT
jgi:ribosomal protein S18 acetylase RimI-like enzyme